MFDVSNLDKIVGMTRKGWTHEYYVDKNGKCLGKNCSGCAEILSSDKFGSSVSSKYGLHGICKNCNNRKSKLFRVNNQEKVKKQSDDKYARNSNRSREEIEIDRTRLHPKGTKKCTKCSVELPFSRFSNRVSVSDGLASSCRTCAYPHYKSTMGVDYINTLAKKYRKNRLSRTDQQLAIATNKAHPSGFKYCKYCGISAPLSEFYKNKERTDGLEGRCVPCYNKRAKMYRDKKYPDYWNSRGIPIKCYVCGTSENLHGDHVIPVDLDGPDSLWNILPLCGSHNSSKSNTPLNVWLLKYHPDLFSEVMHRVMYSYGVWPFVGISLIPPTDLCPRNPLHTVRPIPDR